MTDVLQQPDLNLSFVAAPVQYVHDLQQLSLHLLLSDKLLMSLWTLVQFGDTDTSLQSLCCSGCPVQSSGAETTSHFTVSLLRASRLGTRALTQ